MGYEVLEAAMAFEDYCIENDIINPFTEELKISKKYFIEDKTPNGMPCTRVISRQDYDSRDLEVIRLLKEKQKEFTYQENLFMHNYLQQYYNYEQLKEFDEMHNLDIKILPCECADRQCSLECPEEVCPYANN